MQLALLLIFLCFTSSWTHKSQQQNENLRSSSRNLKNVPKYTGRPLPMPQSYISTPTQHKIDERNFNFQFVKGSIVCDVVTLAFYRYHKIIFRPSELFNVKKLKNVKSVKGKSGSSQLKTMYVNIHSPCEDYPSLESDESFVLEIAGEFASIDANSNWGILRGLETFSQLVVETDDGEVVELYFQICYFQFLILKNFI